MNNEPQENDEKWRALLALSAPTFAGDTAPPYGFVTSTLARLNAEKGERELLEKIGLRSLFASLAVLLAAAGLTVGWQLQHRVDFDPGVRSLIQADFVAIS